VSSWQKLWKNKSQNDRADIRVFDKFFVLLFEKGSLEIFCKDLKMLE
jgi:hypothetical protein